MKALIKKKFGPCPECKTSLLHNCVKVGVRVVMHDGKHNPFEIWNADLYRCPKCEAFIITDWASAPQWTRENTPDLAGLVKEMAMRGDCIFYLPNKKRRAA